MIKKKTVTNLAIVSISTAIILSGCAREPDVSKVNNLNQTPSNLVNNNTSNGQQNTVMPVGANSTGTPVVNNTQSSVINNDKKAQPAAKEPTPQIGTGGDDMFLFTQIRSALNADKELSTAVIVELKEGNAILTGTVPNETLKTKAEQLVKSIKGLKSVKNNLRVSS